MDDNSNNSCSLVSASTLEKQMGISKSYRQRMTKEGLFKAIQLPGQRKRFYNTCQIRESMTAAAESKPKAESPASTSSEAA